MKKIIFIAVLFFSLLSFGQSSNDKIVYLDSIKRQTDSINYTYKKVIKEYYLEKEIYSLEIYNNENTLIYTEEISDKVLLVRNGSYTSYFANGNKMITGSYTKNMLDGKSTEWYENGKIKEESLFSYKNNKSEKTIINFWDEDEVQKVKEGTGDYEFEIGLKDEETLIRGKVDKGLLEGKWNTNPGDFPYYEEYYSKGILLNGIVKYPNNTSVSYTEVSIQAKPEGGMNEFRKQIGSKIKTKKQKTALKGTIVAKFVVDQNGKIKDITIVQSLNPYFDNQLLDVLKNSENWAPGIYRGKNVKQYYTLPISIKVEEAK